MAVDVVYNQEWEKGQSTSVKTGLAALPEGIGAVVFLLVDQPKIPVNLVETLVETHARTMSPIVGPMIGGHRGNPVLFDRITFPDFAEIEGDAGGRQLFSKYEPIWVPWVDDSVDLDVDTLEDYKRLVG
jgi:molybdenum cofactor cytidylyltransferase